MKFVFQYIILLFLVIILILLCNNRFIENYEDIEKVKTDSIPNLNGLWQIKSFINNRIVIINFKQIRDIISTDNNDLGEGDGKIVNNKIIWKWNKERNKMIGDIILSDNKNIVKAIKWQNGNTWNKIQPADNIEGKWIGDGLIHGPINIQQTYNDIRAIYPEYGGFMGTIINNEISIKWINNVKISGILVKDNNNYYIKWDSGLKWTKYKDKKQDKFLNKNKYNLQDKSVKSNIILNIPPPPLEFFKILKNLILVSIID